MALGTDGLLTVVGDVDTITDTKASGTLTVRLSDKLIVGDKVFAPIDQTVNLNPNDGTFSIKLPPVGDTGVTYRFELVAYAFVNGQRESFQESFNTVLTADDGDAQGVVQYKDLAPVATPGVPQTFLTRMAADSRYALKGEVPELPSNLITEDNIGEYLEEVDLGGYTQTTALDAYIAQLMADPTSNIYQALVNYNPTEPVDPFEGIFTPHPRTLSTSLASSVSGVMKNFSKYHLATWYPATYGSQSGQFLNLGGIGETNIRPAATAAEAIAMDLITGNYDAAATGVTDYDANVIAKKLAVSVAKAHKGNTTGGWGGGPFSAPSAGSNPDWQSALWAACAGKAAWFIWNFLTEDEKTLVRNMLITEANRFNAVTVPYWKTKAGVETYPGDSKSEENAWNGMLLGIAALVNPGHANALTWVTKFLEFAVSMNAAPSDAVSSVTLNGLQLSTFLNGSNINDDGTVVNHDAISPDYMTAPKSMWSVGSTFALSGKKIPVGMYLNAEKMYRAMVDVQFSTANGYTAPGGTIYKGGTGDIYYPQGADWGIRYVDKASFDIHGIALGFDKTASVKAETWGPLHYTKTVAQQARYTDGHTYSGTAEDSYSGREQTVGYNTGYALLAAFVADQGLLQLTNDPAAAILADLQTDTTVLRAPIPAPPAAPTTAPTVTLGTPGATSQPLTWTAVPAATGYRVEFKATSASTWTTFAATQTGTSATVTGLTAATSYDYRVTAVNPGGAGPASAVATGSTGAAGSNPVFTDGFTTTSTTGIPGWTAQNANNVGIVDGSGAGQNGTGSTAITNWFEAPAGMQPATANQSVKSTNGAVSATANQAPCVGVRASGSGTGLTGGYWLRWTGGSTNLLQLYKGAGTLIGSYALATKPSSHEIRAVGTTITAYINGQATPVITATDSDYATGKVWLGFRYTAAADNSVRARQIDTSDVS